MNQNTRLLLSVSNKTYALSKEADYTQIIEKSGAIISNCCSGPNNPLVYLMGADVVATDSPRAAHYISRLTGGKTNIWYGSMADCVKAAINGKWKIE